MDPIQLAAQSQLNGRANPGRGTNRHRCGIGDAGHHRTGRRMHEHAGQTERNITHGAGGGIVAAIADENRGFGRS